MSEAFIAALLRELLADPEAVQTLKGLAEPPGEHPPPTPAYTVTSLGRCTGLGEKAIRNAINRGELPARKRAGRWVISAEDVQAWLGPPESRPPRARPQRARPLGSTFDGLRGWR